MALDDETQPADSNPALEAKTADPEERTRAAEIGRALRECLGRLVDDRRRAVSLNLAGHSVPETARLLGFAPKRAENLVYRGLADLRGCLGQEGVGAMTAFGEPREIEGLRKAFRDGATGEPRTPADSETIYRAAAGTLPEPEARRLIDAMADDPDLAEAWALARELVEAERRVERPATVTAIRRPQAARFRGAWTAIAATLALAVGVGVWRQLNPTPTWRGERPDAPIHLLVDDGQRVPKTAVELRWQSTPDLGGAVYRVTVTTLDLTPVTSIEDLSTAAFIIPPAALDALPAGTRLLWRVEARTVDGRTLRSQLSSFVLVND